MDRMAVHRHGSGPDLVLFHGGMGSWRHWTRNVEALAARYTVHALDHPSYGDSAPVPRETTGPAYLDLPADGLITFWNTFYARWLYDKSGWQPWTCRSAL